MPNYLQNVDFPGNSLDVVGVINLPFLKNLDSNFLTGVDMVALFDLAEGALAQCFLDSVIANDIA